MKLKNLGEFGLIERISRKLTKRNPEVLVGIGDDAAVVETGKSDFLVITTDTLIEKVHFDLKYTSFYGLGWKALAINISDCAAMGATPRHAVVTLGLPAKVNVKAVDDLYDGIRALARKVNVGIVGGDTISSPSHLVVSVTLTGEVKKKELLLRSGAKVGDSILVTGDLGGSAAGMKLLKKRKKSYRRLLDRHLMPFPRIAEAKVVSKSGMATSMIDDSDGLAKCLTDICNMSGVGARVWVGEIPISRETARVSRAPVDLALYGGEDYELMFTVPKAKAEKLARMIKRKTGTAVSIVGEIVARKKQVRLLSVSGKEIKLRSAGWEHFGRSV